MSVGAYRAAAYDPLSGKEIWRVSYGDGFSNVPRPGVRPRPRLHRHGLSAADAAGGPRRRHGRRHQDARRLDADRGAPLTPSPLLVGDELYIVSDGGIATCLDAKTGADALAAAAWRQLLGVAGVRRRAHLLSRARKASATVIAPGTRVPQAGDQPARRRDARLDGRVGRLVLHPQRHAPVPHRVAGAPCNGEVNPGSSRRPDAVRFDLPLVCAEAAVEAGLQTRRQPAVPHAHADCSDRRPGRHGRHGCHGCHGGGARGRGTVGRAAQSVFDRAVADFERGRVVESAAGFDDGGPARCRTSRRSSGSAASRSTTPAATGIAGRSSSRTAP